MTYIDGFVVPVPKANRDAYRRHAAEMAPRFRKFGIRRTVEAWGDDVPPGKVTDFFGAVQATSDETVVFAWFEHESREARDEATRRMMADPEMEAMGTGLPFDGKRLIYGGFAPIVDTGSGGGTAGYVDGYIVAVPQANREAYRAVAEEAAAYFEKLGALRTVEAWGDDVPDGKVTDFRRAVKAKPDEAVLFSWVEWPSKERREAAWKQSAAEHPTPPEMPFDGKRMVYGGFEPFPRPDARRHGRGRHCDRRRPHDLPRGSRRPRRRRDPGPPAARRHDDHRPHLRGAHPAPLRDPRGDRGRAAGARPDR
jgi:uncharacterized protein YbaA (DUF1428 family)